MQKYMDWRTVDSTFEPRAWQRVLVAELAATLTSTMRPFPCVFGVAGFRTNQLRFAFPDPLDSASLAKILAAYLPEARSFGPNTSLVVLSRPRPVESIASYRDKFWHLLRELAARDDHPWPSDIPEQLDTPRWEFCFAGEPIFVVCNTPAHVMRQSRRSSSFMLTFQPRWVFDRILGTPEAAERAFAAVREPLGAYDVLQASPALGHYGAPENREFAQYFLGDDNERAQCPFVSLSVSKEKIAC